MISDLNFSAPQFAIEENVKATYLEIARACPGVELLEDPGFLACTLTDDNPMANFAMGLKLDPNVVARLVNIAKKHPSFTIYQQSFDEPRHLDELLLSAGFVARFNLHQLFALPLNDSPSFNNDFKLEDAVTEDARKAVAQFMVSQFFAQRTLAFRTAMVDALVNSKTIGLQYFGSPITSAAMLNRTRDTVGIYNLCVQPTLRGQGIGTKMLRCMRKKAQAENSIVVLQCEPLLTPWYSRNGFELLLPMTVWTAGKLI